MGRSSWYYLVAVLIIGASFVLAVVYLAPSVPRTLIMTTGWPGGDFDQFGPQYRAILAEAGVDLLLKPSSGSTENLSRLNDPKSGISVGFLQGGITDEKRSPDLVSLGTICYEPVWFFYSLSLSGQGMEALRGKKVSIGPEGSGSRELALQFMDLNGIDRKSMELLSLPSAEAAERLLRNEIAAAFIVASWNSPVVRRLISDPGTELARFPRVDAYVALYPFLTSLQLPAGVGSMEMNRPSVNIDLVATTASLVVRKDLPSALQYLLLDAADRIHSKPDIFRRSGEFPALQRVDLPLSQDAHQYYKSGPPFLYRYLSFKLALIAQRALVLLIPLIGVAYPLLRFMPAMFGYGMRRRIFRLYRELRLIEMEWRTAPGRNTEDLLGRLSRLEARAVRMRITIMHAPLLYHLRQHIQFVQSNVMQGKPIP